MHCSGFEDRLDFTLPDESFADTMPDQDQGTFHEVEQQLL